MIKLWLDTMFGLPGFLAREAAEAKRAAHRDAGTGMRRMSLGEVIGGDVPTYHNPHSVEGAEIEAKAVHDALAHGRTDY